MSVILIAACYWPRANNWGAMSSIAVGSIIPVSFLILQQIEGTQEMTQEIGPFKFGIATYVGTALTMVIGSLTKDVIKK